MIITKILIPKRRSDLLHRPRLVNFIHEHVERKLILVSASAGYGKTSLLIDYAHDTDLPVCWYSLDQSDRDPKVFLEYLVASIRQRFPHFGQRIESLLQRSDAFADDTNTVIGALVNEMHEAIPEYFVVVLDDYHLVDESEPVNAALDALLRYLPENCHIILSSRTLPTKLTLTLLTARQEVVGLGVTDLRFTAHEVQKLMRQNYDLDLTDKQAEEIAAHSEGWITGILLSTHAMWQGLFESMIRAKGAEGGVFDYLASEVFAQQSEGVQRFLKESSILMQMSPSLCDELLGAKDSGEMLELIEERNLFVTRLEGEVPWYRYHHLFQEFLRTRLRSEEAGRYNDLHLQAAELFKRRGGWGEAIHHYLKAGAYDEVARVVELVAEETFNSGRWETLSHWIDSLPEDVLLSKPQLLLFRAQVCQELGELDKAIELFGRAHAEFAKKGDRAGMARVLVRKSIALRFKGRHQEAIASCEKALSLDQGDVSVVAQAYKNIGICRAMQGEFSKGAEELSRALQLYEWVNDFYSSATLYHDLGTLHWLTGNISKSLTYSRQALRYWKEVGNLGALANTLNTVGDIHRYQGKYAEALETLEKALEKAREARYLRIESYALVGIGDVYRDLGNYEQALEMYKEGFEIAEQVNEAFIIVYAADAMGNAYRLVRDYDQARELITQALEKGERHRSDYEVGLCKTSLGILCYEQGDIQQALDHLRQALELLQLCGASRELARAHFHLAQALFLHKQFAETRQHLEAALDLVAQLGYDQFIVVEGRGAVPLIKYAISQRIGDGRFTRILEKINRHAKLVAKGIAAPSPAVSVSLAPALEIYALGPARVLLNSHLVSKSEWASATTKELFFYLLAHPQGVRKEQVIDAFWSDIPPAKSNSIFHSTTYRLRRALCPECVIYENGLYRFSPNIDYWFDVEEFERLMSEAKKSEDREEGVECYRRAIALYQGDYLEEGYSDWPLEQRESLREKYIEALARLADFHANKGEYDESIELYKKILAKDSYREEIHRRIMRCYALAGDRASAIKYYRYCVEFLKEELGVEPMPETVALYEAILSGALK